MVLQRVLCNKDQPRIGHLVMSLLCSPAEAKVYEKVILILECVFSFQLPRVKICHETPIEKATEVYYCA
jgi:hypothetical protein